MFRILDFLHWLFVQIAYWTFFAMAVFLACVGLTALCLLTGIIKP